MKITRQFTKPGQDVFSTVRWIERDSRITNSDGSVVFEMKDASVPESWSQLATDIMVSKYFRKAGVPQFKADGSVDVDSKGVIKTGPETSARQVIHRLAGCWRHWGEAHGYFDSAEDAQAFYDELCYMMLHQMAAPNSPQWFNTGLNWAYGITGPAQGHWLADPRTGEVREASDAYTHPQPHACFIQSIRDDLVNEGGIMDLWTREARLFKYGSGTGTNFSSLRGENERLSGGGKSSGLMSFLKIGDRAAGAIKSGGTTRRAAKMVCLDADHPDIEQFVNWKVREELKVAAMVEGMKHLPQDQQDIAKKLGLELDYDFNGEAYHTVSGQNSNNSVRLSDDFFAALEIDGDWQLTRRTDRKLTKTLKARDLWEQICFAAWRCADPGLQYDTTINDWHTCPESGRINASNPCITGDTLVATDTGYRRIADLVGKSATIINGNGERVYVDRIFKTGTRPVFELRTASGYRLKLTADHKVKTANRGDVPACDLTVDDFVMLERPGFGDDFVPEAFGELLGAALGDGCITRGEKQDFLFITVGESERDVAQQLQVNLAECKRWLHAGDGRTVRATEVVHTQTGLRVNTSVAAVLDRMSQIAVLDCGSTKKRLTDAVFGLDQASVAAILRGLFTTDGTVANYGEKSQYVSLDSTSLELLRQVQLLLLGFGIKSKLYENRRALHADTAALPDGKGNTKDYPVQQMHSLRISRSSRVVFEREIGFMTSSIKAKRLAELNAAIGAYEDRFVDRVASLTPCGTEDVFDLTEPKSHHFVANGIVVHNCSEYMFLDNTACNLASLNLMKFYDADARRFDIENYEHAIRLWTIVLEVSVLMASFPSREIAEQSWRYRTLGLGYANLGAMLMQAGIPYDSEEGRAICGALTAMLTGRSYAASAEMAKELGAFDDFKRNREHMLRVIRNHRRAAHGVPRSSNEYEKLAVAPVPIDHDLYRRHSIYIANADEILLAATKSWDDALHLGEKHGYRNAQVTVIAPTGTIGLLMDCDTTGVEPDFALTKFKKLAGGGYFKIANRSLRPALRTLGYRQEQIDDILRYVMGTLSVDTPMPESTRDNGRTLRDFLTNAGYEAEDLIELENALPTVFELRFAFNAWSMPAHVLEELGLNVEAARKDSNFDGLRLLGLTNAQIEELNLVVCGTQTVEGAPHLKAEHLPVFDCASTCGKLGTRFIPTEGHIRMMAASQPFISGAISKTINLPNHATVDDIASAYRLSWELGLKANALYRDGCKLSQPLATRSDNESKSDGTDAVEKRLGEASTAVATASATSTSSMSSAQRDDALATVERVVERIVERPLRRRLADTRRSLTHRFNVGGHEGYLTVGLYDDGRPGELFITMSKEGSTIGGLMDSLGTAISVALQYGVPIESLVNKFAHQRFEPMGMTTNKDIPFAKSLVDYIFRWLGMEFIPGYREANAPKRSGPERPAEDWTQRNVKEDRAWMDGDRNLPNVSHEQRVKSATTPTVSGTTSPAPISGNVAMNGEHAPARIDARQSSSSVRASSTASLAIVETSSSVSRSDGSELTTDSSVRVMAMVSALDQSNAQLMSDAPMCDGCGSITVRNGACYKCMNCGNSLGCS